MKPKTKKVKKWEEEYCEKFGLCKLRDENAKCQCGIELAFIRKLLKKK